MASKLLVVVDLGSSESRVFWSLDKGKVAYCLFSSDCSLPTASQAAGKMATGSFYLKYGKYEFVVGAAAAPGFLSDELREGFKFEGAVPKVLAGVHLAISACECSDVLLTVAVLLPFGELEAFPALKSGLTDTLSKFRCNGVDYALQLERLGCFPEGAGAIKYLVELGYDYEDKRLLTVMAGYRDLTMIRSIGAREVLGGKTAPMGFLWLLKDLEGQVGSLDRLRAAQVLYPLASGRITMTACKPLSRATYTNMVSEDAKHIARAANDSRQRYLQLVENTFARLPLDEIDEVLVLGGTGSYLLPVLQKAIGDKVCFPEQIFERVQDHLEVDRERAIRLADGYAIADLAVDKI